MTSDVPSVQIPAISLVQGSQASSAVLFNKSGNPLPQGGKVAAAPTAAPANASSAAVSIGQAAGAPAAATQTIAPAQQTGNTQNGQKTPSSQPQQSAEKQPAKSDPTTQAAVLNKYLNDSGRPAQFRASSNDKLIEEINPATGEVIAQYSAAEFAELARSVGISGALVNETV